MRKLRISAGAKRLTQLKVPDSARPITGRVKRSIFDTLQGKVADAQVLDLFAGAGNMGLEALSRGASGATFVDSDKRAVELIRQNCQDAGLTADVQIVLKSAGEFLRHDKRKFDLIFLDPPFDKYADIQLHLLPRAMHKDTIVVLRKPRFEPLPRLPKGLIVLFSKNFGNSEVVYMGSP